MSPFNRHKKTANSRRNEWIRGKPKPLAEHFRMDTWVALPVSPENNMLGDLNAEPRFEVQLRKCEADQTNHFCIQNKQDYRYEKKSSWLNIWRQWNRKLQ